MTRTDMSTKIFGIVFTVSLLASSISLTSATTVPYGVESSEAFTAAPRDDVTTVTGPAADARDDVTNITPLSTSSQTTRDSSSADLVTNNSTTNIEPSILAKVTLAFDADFNEIIAKIGLLELEKGMKKSIVQALSIEDWRVQNVSCTNGSIITTFLLFPPNEGTADEAAEILNQDINQLQKVVEDGTLSVDIAGLDSEIHVVSNQTIIFEFIGLGEVGESTKEEKRKIGSYFVAIGVILGVGIIVIALFIAKKYRRSPGRPSAHDQSNMAHDQSNFVV